MLAWMRGTNYMALLTRTALAAAEAGWLPDAWLRWGVRRLCRERLGDLVVPVSESQQTQLGKFVAEMDAAPIALVPERANSQHYEVPLYFLTMSSVHNKNTAVAIGKKALRIWGRQSDGHSRSPVSGPVSRMGCRY